MTFRTHNCGCCLGRTVRKDLLRSCSLLSNVTFGQSCTVLCCAVLLLLAVLAWGSSSCCRAHALSIDEVEAQMRAAGGGGADPARLLPKSMRQQMQESAAAVAAEKQLQEEVVVSGSLAAGLQKLLRCCPGLTSLAGKQSNGVLAGTHSSKNPVAAGEVPISNSPWLRGFPSEGYCVVTLLLHSAATCAGPFFLQPLFDKQKVAELSVKYGGPSTQGSKLVVGHSDDEEGSDEGWGLTGADDDMPSAAGNARKRGPGKDKGKPGTKGGAAKGRKGGEQLPLFGRRRVGAQVGVSVLFVQLATLCSVGSLASSLNRVRPALPRPAPPTPHPTSPTPYPTSPCPAPHPPHTPPCRQG